jgi:hypothetical protein
MYIERKMANGLLGELQQLASGLTVGQVVLFILAAGFVLLVVDYTRVLLLRRKMVSKLCLKTGLELTSFPATRPIPPPYHRKYSSTT